MYVEVTNSIEIKVEPRYVDDQSRPQDDYFFFAYKVRIFNQSNHSVQLLSRRWVITDGHGNTEEVEGPGVVGQQPKIPPGESYEYLSFCPLATPTGNMRGTYMMVDDEGRKFEINIPLFFLRAAPLMH